MTATPTRTPAWSARPWTEHDRAEVLELFTEPDFYFRTVVPDTRPEWEIVELLDTDTRVLLADGRLTGLYAIEAEGGEHGGHHLLHLRLRADAPACWWTDAYAEIVRAARWHRELVRLDLRLPAFDGRGLRAARELGLIEEGTLAGVDVHDGGRHGRVYFAQIWTPTS